MHPVPMRELLPGVPGGRTLNGTVECGRCAHFSRNEDGAGRCTVKSEGTRRWLFLLYGNFPIVCGDYADAEPSCDAPESEQGRLKLEAAR